MSIDALIGLALVVIVAAFIVGAVAMRRQPRPGGRRDPGRRDAASDPGHTPMMYGYPAATGDAGDQTDRGDHPDTDHGDSDAFDGSDSGAGDGGGDGGGGGGGGDSGGGGGDGGSGGSSD